MKKLSLNQRAKALAGGNKEAKAILKNIAEKYEDAITIFLFMKSMNIYGENIVVGHNGWAKGNTMVFVAGVKNQDPALIKFCDDDYEMKL